MTQEEIMAFTESTLTEEMEALEYYRAYGEAGTDRISFKDTTVNDRIESGWVRFDNWSAVQGFIDGYKAARKAFSKQ